MGEGGQVPDVGGPPFDGIWGIGGVRDAWAHGADVDVRAITKRFGAVVAVEAVSFTVRAGEFFSLLGPSGCGKTTTLRTIGGFEIRDAETSCIGGQ